ncbi:MarR family transcriptional regulator [bacterium]|nr:MarR family transcriptional regulator [bacterium]
MPEGGSMDWIDDFSAAWAREYPDAADTSSLLLVSRLARMSVLIDAFQREVLEPFGLTPSDYAVLAALRRAGSPYQLAPSRLYSGLERSSGGMTKMLKRLENLECVERTPDPADGRSILVRLTPTGIGVEEDVFKAFLAATHDLLTKVFSPGRLEAIDESLRSLLDAIEAHFYR